MTKLEELKAAAAYADAVIAVFEAARDAVEAEYNDSAAARAAWAAIWAPFQAELKKIREENSND
jgi:hypothetical protein